MRNVLFTTGTEYLPLALYLPFTCFFFTFLIPRFPTEFPFAVAAEYFPERIFL